MLRGSPQLRELFLSQCQINSSTLQQGLQGLPDSQLKSLLLRSNPLDDAAGSDIAKLLIKKVDNQDKWLSTTAKDRDFERAVSDTDKNTTLTFLDLTDTQIGDVGKHALRLVQRRGGLNYSNLPLDETNTTTDSKKTDQPSAAFSAELLNMNMILLVVIIIYLFKSEKLWNLLHSIVDSLSSWNFSHQEKPPVVQESPKLSESKVSLLPSQQAKIRETVHEKVSVPCHHQ